MILGVVGSSPTCHLFILMKGNPMCEIVGLILFLSCVCTFAFWWGSSVLDGTDDSKTDFDNQDEEWN